MELDKLHVRDNVKLAEVNIKMFLYQDNIPMFEIWLCLSSNVKAKKMSLFFHKCATKQKTAKERKSVTVKIDVLLLCYRFFCCVLSHILQQVYVTFSYVWNFFVWNCCLRILPNPRNISTLCNWMLCSLTGGRKWDWNQKKWDLNSDFLWNFPKY